MANSPPQEEDEALELVSWVDDIADRFEAAWRAGNPPSLDEYLEGVPGPHRLPLKEELEKIDRAYRQNLLRPEAEKESAKSGDFPGPASAAGANQLTSSEGAPPAAVNPDIAPLTFPTLSRDLEARPPAAPREMPAVPGYEMLEELGHGGMGVVYKARQVNLPRLVALKIIPAEFTWSRRKRFLAEGQAVARLRHPNIVQLYEVGEHHGRPFFTMEFLEAGSLAQRLGGQPQAPRLAAALVETLARAVQHAHEQGIVHRDLKPANILLAQSDQPSAASVKDKHPAELKAENSSLAALIPKISDFGLAKQLAELSPDQAALGYQTQTGEILGTPSYMAPEQAEGKVRDIGPPADIYALGTILYEMLTGRPPFKGETTLATLEQVRTQEPVPPSHLQPKLPRDLSTICLKALAKAPGRRYATAGALADDLRRFLDGQPIHARPVSSVEKAWRWCRRNPAEARLIAAVALVLLAGTVVSTFFAVQADRRAKETQRTLYGAHMNLAQRYWREGQISHVLAFLHQHESDAERGWEWHYLLRQCHADLSTLTTGQTSALTLAFSPDGRRLASVGKVIQLWDVPRREVQRTLTLPHDWEHAEGIVFAPDNGLLVWRSKGERKEVWDAARGQVPEWLQGHLIGITSVAFNRDGRFLAMGDTDGQVHLWNTTPGKSLRTLPAHDGWVGALALSPDGQVLASTTDAARREIKLWDTASGRQLHTLTGHTNSLTHMAFSPDGQRLAATCNDLTVRVWDVAAGRLVHMLKGHTRGASRVAFSPDGQRLASAGADNMIKLWDPVGGEELNTLRGHTSYLTNLAFSPDGRLLASAARDEAIKLWDARGGQEAHTLAGDTGVAFSPDGRYLAAPGPAGTVKIWDAAGLQPLRILKGQSSDVWAVAFSPDSRRLAAATGVRKAEKWAGGEVSLWDTETGRLQSIIRAHGSRVFSVAFSPDGSRLATGSQDGTVKIWDAATNEELHAFQHLPRPGTEATGLSTAVHQVAFSPDGRLLASASDDRTVKVWDTLEGREQHTLARHTHWVYGVTFSPDGQHLASASHDTKVKIWDVSTGKVLRDLIGHNKPVTSVTYSPDGKRVVTGEHGTIKIWDTSTGQELCTLNGHTQQVWALAFSPDGWRLASASQDATVKLWDARPLTLELAVEREAVSLVDFLFAKPLAKKEVLARIQADLTISDAVRQKALAFAERACEDPHRFTPPE